MVKFLMLPENLWDNKENMEVEVSEGSAIDRNTKITGLKEKLGTDIEIKKVSEMGWNNDALEAQIFAYLAVKNLLGEPISFPNITGVPRPLTGGRCVLPSRSSA